MNLSRVPTRVVADSRAVVVVVVVVVVLLFLQRQRAAPVRLPDWDVLKAFQNRPRGSHMILLLLLLAIDTGVGLTDQKFVLLSVPWEGAVGTDVQYIISSLCSPESTSVRTEYPCRKVLTLGPEPDCHSPPFLFSGAGQ